MPIRPGPFPVLVLLLAFLAVAAAQEPPVDAGTRRFLERFQTVIGTPRESARLLFDGVPVLTLKAGKLECVLEGGGRERVLVVRSDGAEAARVALPRLELTAKDLPPLAVPDLDAVTVKSESRSLNGVSTTRVWLDGRLVYEGPGAQSRCLSSSRNGRRSTEVTVDGRVVYRIGEGQGAAPPVRSP